MASTPVRHDLLRIDPAAWPAMLRDRPGLDALVSLQDWKMRGYPVMSRRRLPDDPGACWPVAIALPPSQGKLRLALNIAPDHVADIRPPPLLLDVLRGELAGRLPDAWTDKAARAADAGARAGMPPRLFGSAMWQCVTGMDYVTDTSDLDLIWPVAVDAFDRVPELLRALLRLEETAGPRLDGEIVFGAAGAVQWRELAAAQPEDTILVKTEHSVEIMTRAGLLALAGRR